MSSPSLTARDVVERLQAHLGVPWQDSGGDGFQAGSPELPVTGIVTTWTPTLDVLRRSVARGRNLIVSRECAFWTRESAVADYSGAGATATRQDLAGDATFRFKQAFIAQHDLAIFRLARNWDARRDHGQLEGLTRVLGWDKHATPRQGIFDLPPAPLGELATAIRDRMDIRGMRVVGDPRARVSRAAVAPGFLLVPALQRLLAEPGVDVVVTGEPVEWEAFPYVEDLIAAGMSKGMILLGHEVSAEPGCAEQAAWLRTIVPEVPVDFLPAGEPFWMPRRG